MNGKRFIAADNANNCATDCNQKAKGNIDYCVEASGAETDVFCLAGFASTGTAPNRDCATVCTAASACVTCLKDKAAECDTCAKGKYKDAAAANVCKDCPANVAACTAADVHTECATGYLLG